MNDEISHASPAQNNLPDSGPNRMIVSFQMEPAFIFSFMLVLREFERAASSTETHTLFLVLSRTPLELCELGVSLIDPDALEADFCMAIAQTLGSFIESGVSELGVWSILLNIDSCSMIAERGS